MAKGQITEATIKARYDLWASVPENTVQRTRTNEKKDKDGKVVKEGASVTVDLRPLWECTDLAILRSYAASTVSGAARVKAGIGEAGGDVSADAVASILFQAAGVKGFGEDKVPGAVSKLKAQDALVAAYMASLATGTKKEQQDALEALKAFREG